MTFKIAILAEDSSGKPADSRKCEKCATFVRQIKFNQHPESTNLFTEGLSTCHLPSSADYTATVRWTNKPLYSNRNPQRLANMCQSPHTLAR